MTKFLVSAAAAAALGAAVAATPVAAQTVKIGFIATFSGPGGTIGTHLYDGFMLGIEHAGGKLGGLTPEVIKEDDQLKPDVGLQAAQKLLQRDKVNFISGVIFSNVMMAIYKPVIESQTFLISSNAGPSPIAGAQCSPYFFSTSWQNDDPHAAMGKHLQDKGIKRLYLMAPNYQAGKDALTGVKRMFKGEIVDEIYTTVNQPDYSAEIAALRAAKPEALYVFYPGGMGINFVKQYAQAGLVKALPLYSAFTTDSTTVDAQGDAAIGTFGTAFWTVDLKNPANQKFVADFRKKHNYEPSTYSAQAYDSAQLIDAALKATGGKLDNKDALRDALRKADFKSIRGPFKFNNNQFPIQSYYLYETVREDGKLRQLGRGTVLTDHADVYAKDCPMKW
ncbi:MAG: ABC transporter substrate-binding protein [Proteobacteria bacterium]|nr:ABC transporter substrate-binding protein [Pseudomonadota bacterium]